MTGEEKILKMLEGMQQQMTSMQEQITSLEKNTNQRFDAVDQRFEGIDQRLDSLEQTIITENEITREELKTEIQYVYGELQELRTDFTNIEQVTAKNWLDISRIKAIK